MKKNKIIDFDWCKYSHAFKLGSTVVLHNHICERWHFHLWIDLGFRCLEISVNANYDYTDYGRNKEF
ncbi:MAG: hypothetical protein GY853_09680 [PVC group bacterium]|nr:hypothetical protein [PVC group bacterium]